MIKKKIFSSILSNLANILNILQKSLNMGILNYWYQFPFPPLNNLFNLQILALGLRLHWPHPSECTLGEWWVPDLLSDCRPLLCHLRKEKQSNDYQSYYNSTCITIQQVSLSIISILVPVFTFQLKCSLLNTYLV